MKTFQPRSRIAAAVMVILTTWALSALVNAALAAPFCWIWNVTFVPLGLRGIDYGQAYGILLLWVLLRAAWEAVTIRSDSRADDER